MKLEIGTSKDKRRNMQTMDQRRLQVRSMAFLRRIFPLDFDEQGLILMLHLLINLS